MTDYSAQIAEPYTLEGICIDLSTDPLHPTGRYNAVTPIGLGSTRAAYGDKSTRVPGPDSHLGLLSVRVPLGPAWPVPLIL